MPLLCRLGRIPEERLWGTCTYRLILGAVAITSHRFLVWTGCTKHVNPAASRVVALAGGWPA